MNVSSGETDLATILDSISVSVRPDRYVLVALPEGAVLPTLGNGVAALVTENEGTTAIATVERASEQRWEYEFVASWLTIDVHSSLEAVGLTAAFSAQLGRRGIPCNVVAGFYHDHILVPVDKTDEAVDAIEALGG